jgi:CarboxypepD_reg-like domain/TonB-dependent Receptor Plug Domain
MKKTTLLFYIIFIAVTSSFSQGTIRGKVSDKTGETLIGVTVALKSNPSMGTVSDFDGNFSLKLADSSTQVITISYVSYQTIEFEVHPKKGEVIVKDFVMESSTKDLAIVEVVTKSTKAKEYYMENIKKNSSTTIDYISSETMKKTGDANVVAAVARVTGVSTNGGFITVRGIGDRYVKTTINGSRIPTLDPFTNNIKLDMFPAALVDNIIITKTASPDLPGDFAGAYLSVETKDYPEQLALTIETQAGYNNQTSFKDVLSSQRSSTDWQGYDNSFREHDHSQFQSANTNISQYQEMVALGLGDYYKSIGVTGWVAQSNAGNVYFDLGLVKLGLLSPALINNPAAVAAATAAYNNGPYHSQAYSIINAGAAKTGQSFPNNWNTTQRKAPLGFSQSFTLGDQLNVVGKQIGFIAGFRYGSSTIYDPNSIAETPYPDSKLIYNHEERALSSESNGWSALINAAYKINPNNSVSLLFMPNMTGVNKVTEGYDTVQRVGTKAQFYESRKQMVYQFKSEHYLPVEKIKLDLNASYTKGSSNAPDFKYFQFDENLTTGTFSVDPLSHTIDRFYRYLTDNIFDSHASAEIPLGNKPGLIRKLKIGGAYQQENTKSDQYDYQLSKGTYNFTPLVNDDIDTYLNLNQFAITQGTNGGVPYSTMNWFYTQDEAPTNHAFGRSNIKAAFIMTDFTVIPRIRISGGVRMETTNMFTDLKKFDSLGLSDTDPRRFYAPGILPATPGRINNTNLLPSATLIYKLINKDESPTNIRIGYSQTLARPSLREISNITNFDYELRANVQGNPDLKMVEIKNYDFRIESYFKNKDNISLSVFYKDFKNHIELEQGDVYTWINVDKSYAEGIELEGRKGIVKGLEFRANVTLVKSYTTYIRTRKEVSGTVVNEFKEDTVSHSMFGQAPYIINGILSYTSDTLGLTATVSYNIQGPRLVIGSRVSSMPLIYEMPRNLLDFKVTKKLGKHFSISVTIRDILNSTVTRKYKMDDGYNVTYDSYRWGTNYLLGVSYKL